MSDFASSDSRTLNISPNQSQTVSDQGVAVSNRGNAGQTIYRLGKGASYTSGITADQLTSAIGAALTAQQQTNNVGQRDDDPSGFSIADLLAAHFQTNADTSADTAAAESAGHLQRWSIVAVAIVGAVALWFVLRRKK